MPSAGSPRLIAWLVRDIPHTHLLDPNSFSSTLYYHLDSFACPSLVFLLSCSLLPSPMASFKLSPLLSFLTMIVYSTFAQADPQIALMTDPQLDYTVAGIQIPFNASYVNDDRRSPGSLNPYLIFSNSTPDSEAVFSPYSECAGVAGTSTNGASISLIFNGELRLHRTRTRTTTESLSHRNLRICDVDGCSGRLEQRATPSRRRRCRSDELAGYLPPHSGPVQLLPRRDDYRVHT